MEDKTLIYKLKENINKLKTLYNGVIDENNVLNIDLNKLKEEKKEIENKIFELEAKNDQLMMTKALLLKEGDSDVAKEKINLIVREIDKCIALMNK